MSKRQIRAGVVGVGSMGQNHARVYRELPDVTLSGVYDVDVDRAERVADEYDTDACSLDGLVEKVDLVSVAVPTQFHYEMARRTIEAGVDTLIEKPFVADPANGRELIDLADENDVALQVGHIERFNPAVVALREIASDLDIVALDAQRLGPPLERDIEDTVVMDLMIHDVDIVLDLVDSEVASVNATGTANGSYADATFEFDSGVVGSLTASRTTQEKVRGITISARDCRVKVDYTDQTMEVHRKSNPTYIREDGNVHFHHENVVEQLAVERNEPLKNELQSFADAVRSGEEPEVTGHDGLRALELTQRVNRLAFDDAGENEAAE